MATLEDIDTLAQDTTFRTKVRGGIARIAGEIGSNVLNGADVDKDGNPTFSAQTSKLRLILARAVLSDMDTWTDTFARVLAADSSITIAVDDNTLLFFIRDYWNLLTTVGI